MKILTIGDFHGEFPNKFEKIIKKEKIQAVISVGDYPPFHYRKLWFKYCFDTNKQLWEIIGKENYKKLVHKDLEAAEKVLKKLNSLPIPVFTTIGNIDYTRTNDSLDKKRYEKLRGKSKHWDFDEQDFFTPILKKYKNIQRIDYQYAKIKNYVLIGCYGGTNPGHVKSKAFQKHKKILDNLFKKFSKENKEKRVIFVTHNPPYNTKIDKIGDKAHESVRGKHFGSKMVRRLINHYQPLVSISGHIHEAKGIAKLNQTIAINTGAAHEGQAAIIFLPDSPKEKLKVKFIN